MSARLRQFATIVVALLLVGAPIGPAALVDTAAASTAPPDGFVTLPDSNVHEDLPVGENASLRASDLEGSVMASDHASSLEVVVTTPDRATDYTNGSVVGSGSVALVFRDDTEHEGREVAVPADAIRDSVGYLPKVVHGVHEDGTEWTSQVEARNGLLIFEIPKFSSNTVTFEGETVIEATPAQDGSSYSYDLGNPEAVTAPNVTFTGSTATEWDNESVADVADGGTVSIDVAGDLDPTGPANGDPEVTLTASVPSSTYNPVDDDGSGDAGDNADLAGDTGDGALNPELKVVPTSSGELDSLTVNIESTAGADYGPTVDVYLVNEGPDWTSREGDKIATWSPEWSTGEQEIQLDSSPSVVAGETYALEFVTDSTDGDGSEDLVRIATDTSASDDWITTNDGSGPLGLSAYPDVSLGIAKPVNSATVTDPATGSSAEFGSLEDGETASGALDLSTSSDSLDVAVSGGGTVDVDVALQEHTETRDPAVSINNETLSHSGTLAEGESVTYTGDESWLQDGTNTVTVQVGDDTLSADAPTPQVDLQYSHSSQVEATTQYAANGWEESYDVSHTFADDRETPTLTIPFSTHIYEIREVETSVNGGSWESVSSDRWELQNGTTLLVELDDGDGDGKVDAGDTVAVHASGYKIDVRNGDLTVLDPTTPDDSTLDSEVRLDFRTTGFEIGVAGTWLGDRVHYTYEESWSEADEYVVIDADGDQDLHLPNAQEGDTFRVTTIPLEAEPSSGDVSVHVANPDDPTFTLGPGEVSSSDDVLLRYYGATSGESYELYSVSRGRVLEKSDADAEAVEFSATDGEETFRIRGATSDDSSGGGTGIGGGGSWTQNPPETTLRDAGIVGGWVLLVVLLVAATGRSSVRGRPRWMLVGAVSAGSALLSIEVLRPGSVSGAVAGGVEEIVPLGGLVAFGIAGYSVFSWWQSRREEAATPETEVTFDLGGRR
ncbi:hypothetical protein [Halorarum salinum]|uniref:Uncharacterized protein n=1 Tax=Halorarum salinum TaxID=2743089 RepID=A0A7D5LBK8_9EURY|nr:hypothetical protein [Halobaculum salinum]QLG62195.1 hypothetical protein HUG12_10810 [Halobaculum salinum]